MYVYYVHQWAGKWLNSLLPNLYDTLTLYGVRHKLTYVNTIAGHYYTEYGH